MSQDNMGFGDRLDFSDIRLQKEADGLMFKTNVITEAFYKPAYERGVKELMWRDEGPNKITNQGKTHVLEAIFRAATSGVSPFDTAPNVWSVGIYENTFDDSSFDGTEVIGDIAPTHEFTDYSETTRQPLAYTGAPTSGAYTSGVTTAATFTCNPGAPVTVGGIFVISNNVKGGTSGTLWCVKAFTTGDRSVDSSTVLQITYLIDTTGSD